MGRKKKTINLRVLSVLLSLLMVLSVISFPTLKAKASGGTLDDFVERCYTVTLDRSSDPEGFAYWKGKLLNGEAVGNEVAYGFLFSKEYTNKNKSNSAYVRDLYTLFMGRDPDDSGYNDWMNQLDEGKSRLEVFAGFANSQEFYNICDSYSVSAGRWVNGYDRYQINNVNLYVERFYKICLGRIGDRDGQRNWTEKLLKKEISGSECARSFIFSQEYLNKGLSDEEYVENLYLAIMGRNSDPEGKTNWLTALSNGYSRDEVFSGFVNSAEFANICSKYNIDRGSYSPRNIGDHNPKTPTVEIGYRISKTEYSNGDYSIHKYDESNQEISEIRYDKNGNYKCYNYREETLDDGSVYRGWRDYGTGYTIYKEDHSITQYNSDKTQRKELSYFGEWENLKNYDLYTDKQYTYTSDEGTYTSYHPVNGTFYDKNGYVTGSAKYEYYSDNRPKKITQYNEAGKLYWTTEYEFYNKKGGETQFIKKYTETEYHADGSVYAKTVSEYDEDEKIIRKTTYTGQQLETRIEYTYNSNGDIIQEIGYGVYDNIVYEYYHVYDSKGNKIKGSRYDWGVLKGYSTYTYDANNRVTCIETYTGDNDLVTTIKYAYNKNGDETLYSYTNEGNLYETLTEYNENGYKIRMSHKKNGVEDYWEKYIYEEYTK